RRLSGLCTPGRGGGAWTCEESASALANSPQLRGVAVNIAVLRTCLLLLDAPVDLLAMHGDTARRIDADADLVALHAQHGDGDVVTDHDRLSDPSCQNQHVTPLCVDLLPSMRTASLTHASMSSTLAARPPALPVHLLGGLAHPPALPCLELIPDRFSRA